MASTLQSIIFKKIYTYENANDLDKHTKYKCTYLWNRELHLLTFGVSEKYGEVYEFQEHNARSLV